MQTQYSKQKQSPTLNQLLSLEGKTALIIGGAGLLGSQISYALAELGAELYIASRDIDKCNQVITNIKNEFPDAVMHAVSVDITDKASLAKCKDIVGADGAGLDILVNAGWNGIKNTFHSINDEDWDLDIDVCLSGVFHTIKVLHPLLKMNQGTILNIASMYGHVAPDYRLYDSEKFANPPSYGAAKAGVIQLTKYLASFLSEDQIRVNCISPGPFPFESTQQENPEFINRLAAKNPLNRIGKPYEVKAIAALLCSSAGSYINGQNICVDGGWGIW